MMMRIQYSGYEQEFRYEVLSSALNAYDKLRQSEARGERPLYRPKEWNAEEREEARELKKRNWYKRGGYETVVFVPATPNSQLRKRYEKVIERTGIKMRVVEQSGVSLKRTLQRSDPAKNQTCWHPECLVCSTGGKGPCDVVGINYDIECVECAESIDVGRQVKYTGESSRTAYSRGKEHLDDLDKKREKSRMWKHCKSKHAERVPDFRMHVKGIYSRDAMLRQITEAVRINNAPAGSLMNDKTEWNFIRIPRMIMEQ